MGATVEPAHTPGAPIRPALTFGRGYGATHGAGNGAVITGTPPSRRAPRPPDWLAVAGRAGLVGLLYLAASRYAIFLNAPGHLGASFWPGAGIAVTAILLTPRRQWPWFLAAIALAEVVNDLVYGHALVPSLWWAAANVTVALTAGLLVPRWQARELTDVESVLRFTAAVLVAVVLGGVIGAIGLVAAGSGAAFLTLLVSWAAGDAVGVLTLTPLCLALVHRDMRRGLVRPEAVAILLALTAVTVLVFQPFGATGGPPLVFLVIPLLMWAGVRLGVAGAGLATLLVAHVANHAQAFGNGGLLRLTDTAAEATWLLQVFLLTVTVTTLVLAARTMEVAAHLELVQSREALLSVVSHELRTPLTPILGFSELALRHDPDLSAPTREALEAIHRNATHLRTVIDDLLTLSRERRGRLHPEPRVVDLAPLAGAMVDDLDQPRVHVVAHDGPTLAWADAGHVTQIVSNLLSNAVRHGRPPIVLEVRGNTRQVRLTVSDDGDGVSRAFLPHLFDEFAQPFAGDLRPTSGLGIGLPLARSLAEANGGTLTYESRHPRGARFVVTLPTPVGAGAEAADDPAEDRAVRR